MGRKGREWQKKREKRKADDMYSSAYSMYMRLEKRREEKRAERKDAETQKPKPRGEASPRSDGIIIIMARAIIFSLVPTLPDAAASSSRSNVIPVSLFLIAAACTFTNLK